MQASPAVKCKGQTTVNLQVRIRCRNTVVCAQQTGVKPGHKPKFVNNWAARCHIRRQGQHHDAGQAQQHPNITVQEYKNSQNTGQLTAKQQGTESKGRTQIKAQSLVNHFLGQGKRVKCTFSKLIVTIKADRIRHVLI